MSQIPLFSILGRHLATSSIKNGLSSLSPLPRLLSTTSTATAQAAAEPKVNKKTKSSAPKETNSLVMNMFNGHIRTDLVFPYPDVLTDEHYEILEMIQEPQKKLYEKFDPMLAEEKESYQPEHMEAVKAMGGYGIMVSPEYGGAGLNNTQYARLGEIMGSKDLAIGIVLGAHQSIGYKGIVLFGTDEQKQKYLPDLATGKKLAAFALTEPSAGSDASSIQCRAVLSPDGSHYVLNGSKCWISNGGIADLFTVFARTHVKTDSGEVKDKVSAFIVERAFGGVTNGPPEKKMGIKASNTAEVFFDNVKIPASNLLGKEGDGFKVAMNILNSGRFGMGAALTGSMKTCIETAVAHAKSRKQFGDYLCNFGTIQEKIARMAMAHYTTETLAYLISGIMDRGFTEFQLEAAIGKIVASEAAWFVSDEALQILGGMGYVRAPGIEKFVRDIRIFRIFEGTNEILRLFIALTGLQAAGSSLKELQKAISKPISNIGLLFDEGTKRVLKSVGFSGPNVLAAHVAPELQVFANLAAKGVSSFSNSVEYLLRRYNKDIIHEQFLLNRLANSAIDIFVMMAILSRASRAVSKNLPSSQVEVNLASVICSEAAERIQNNLGYLRSSSSLKNMNTMRAIASEVFSADGVAHKHPIDRI